MSDGKLVLSYGAGVNTFALLLKLPEWNIKPDVVVFANTGNEQPQTYEHLEQYQIPEMKRQGLKFVMVKHPKWASLLEYSLAKKKMPPRNIFKGKGRYCTTMFKVDPIIRFESSIRENEEHFVNIIGIAYDEIQRMSTVGKRKWITNSHPLIDHKVNRADCETIIRLAGFPIPPKSGCDFCPFQKKYGWARTERDNPTGIDDGIKIENAFNEKMKAKLEAKGQKKYMWWSLRADGMPLEQWRKEKATKQVRELTNKEQSNVGQTFLDDVLDATCDTEHCMT